jgi:MoaA/NifB/PqqE/SkfB family radical SAM enzyme
VYESYENDKTKVLRSEEVNFFFNKKNGLMVTTGPTEGEDAVWSPHGPFILDMEVSTICSGLGTPCAFCYKSNSLKGKNMRMDTFKEILSKFDLKVLTQIAFGIGDLTANPYLFNMFQHCRDREIIPNVTINGHGLTVDLAKRLASVCGAVAVSCYDKDVCYTAVQMLGEAGLKQTNIHMLLAEDTLDKCSSVLEDVKKDPRLSYLNALVFLHLKPKGRAKNCSGIKSRDKYKALIERAFEMGVNIGFDSCGANLFADTIKDRPEAQRLAKYIEPCESGLFSSYIDVDGQFWPCSFSEDVDGIEPLDVLSCESFTKDVWLHPATEAWRKRLLSCGRNCPIYKIA